MNRYLRTWMILLCMLFLPLPQGAWAQGALSLEVSGRLRPYRPHDIAFVAPEAGVLTLEVLDDFTGPYVIYESAVEQGEGIAQWDALMEAGEPLERGLYTLRARLQTATAVYEDSAELDVSAPVCAVMFGLPSTRVLRRGETMTFEYCLSNEGMLRLELLDAEGVCARRWNIKRAGCDPSRVTWNGLTANGREVPAGVYTARFSVPAGDTRVIEKTFAVLDDPAPESDIALSEQYLPDNPNDPDDLWRVMMAPVVVAQGEYTEHVRVLASPGGELAGEIHARTQAVCVLSLDEPGWAFVGCWRHEDGAYIEGYIERDKLYTVTPNDEYGVLIDKTTQTITVYREGVVLALMPVSTGLMDAEKLFRETRAGAFLLADRSYEFESDDIKYRYAVRFDGGNLLHELGHIAQDSGKQDFSAQIMQLGIKASHGCVRLPHMATVEGVNAYWIWSHLPPTVKVLVLDDRAARDARMRELDPTFTESQPSPFESSEAFIPIAPLVVSAAPISEPDAAPVTNPTEFPNPIEPTAAPVTEPTPTAAPAPVKPDPPIPDTAPDTLVLTLAGDCVLGSEDRHRSKENSFDSTVERLGYEWPFSGVIDLFTGDDITMVNLECCFKDNSQGRVEKLYNFRAPTDFARILPLGSVELVNVANNHFIDYGAAGRRSTLTALEDVNVAYCGFRSLYTFEKAGLKLGFGGIRETVYRQDPSIMQEDIEALLEMGCDIVIYSCHFGNEYATERTELQQSMAYAAIDWGADIVVGCHPHVVQGIETYGDGLIFYSLGNFSFGGNLELTVFDGLAVRLSFKRLENVAHCDVRLLPVAITGIAPLNDFCPLLLPRGEAFDAVIQKIQFDSPEPVQTSFTHVFPLPAP